MTQDARPSGALGTKEPRRAHLPQRWALAIANAVNHATGKRVRELPDHRGETTVTEQRDLQGLKALVTGSTAGLGRAIAMQLAREGAEVFVHGRDAARGAQTLEAIRAEGGRARFVAADLSDTRRHRAPGPRDG